MNQVRVNSSPDLNRPSTPTTLITQQQYDDSALEGVAANIKLLLKLTQDHKNACDKEKNSSRRMLRVATMMTILDNIRDRIQKCQSFGSRALSGAELRRANTIPRPNNADGLAAAVDMDDEKERLRRELSASLAAQRNLQAMCSSLGKEKEIMSAELSRKVHELSETEELINDLKAQNESLLEKVKRRNNNSNNNNNGAAGELQVTSALQERNKALSEQLLRALDGYRSMKRKLKAAQEENAGMRSAMDEMRGKIAGSLERIRGFKGRGGGASCSGDCHVDVQEEIAALEGMFKCFEMMVCKCDGKKKDDCAHHKGEINACKPSVLA